MSTTPTSIDDAPLREDVRLLGRILGETMNSKELFERAQRVIPGGVHNYTTIFIPAGVHPAAADAIRHPILPLDRDERGFGGF